MSGLSLRIDFPACGRVGPGKVRLLEMIDELGSISAAGRALGMSYKRAWNLIDELNGIFREPVIATQTGGSAGGGAVLTPCGREIVERYRHVEAVALAAAAQDLAALQALLAPTIGERPQQSLAVDAMAV